MTLNAPKDTAEYWLVQMNKHEEAHCGFHMAAIDNPVCSDKVESYSVWMPMLETDHRFHSALLSSVSCQEASLHVNTLGSLGENQPHHTGQTVANENFMCKQAHG